ncbi:MAG TPA: hypothetical protein VIL71_14855, partial [Spirillospora sp.]
SGVEGRALGDVGSARDVEAEAQFTSAVCARSGLNDVRRAGGRSSEIHHLMLKSEISVSTLPRNISSRL